MLSDALRLCIALHKGVIYSVMYVLFLFVQERGFTSSSSSKRGSGVGTSNHYSSTSVQKVSSGGGAVNFDDAVPSVIADVRNDSSETTWLVEMPRLSCLCVHV